MCGRFSMSAIQDVLLDRFNVEFEGNLLPRYNISPSQDVPIIMNSMPDKLVIAKWGLLPHWAKDKPEIGYKMINAKVETIAEKPAYKGAFKESRCLIPADGFYEWKIEGDGKVPYRFVLKDGGLFAFAGVWTEWNDSKGDLIRSFSIITVQPNELVKTVHDRMPAILQRKFEKTWLQDAPEEKLLELLVPYPASEMKKYQVSKLVNYPKNDLPELIKPIVSSKKSLSDY